MVCVFRAVVKTKRADPRRAMAIVMTLLVVVAMFANKPRGVPRPICVVIRIKRVDLRRAMTMIVAPLAVVAMLT